MMRLAVAALIRTQEALEALAAQQVEQEVGEVLPERMPEALGMRHPSAARPSPMAVEEVEAMPREASAEQVAAVKEQTEHSIIPRQERRTRAEAEAEATSTEAAQEQQADRESLSCATRMFIRI